MSESSVNGSSDLGLRACTKWEYDRSVFASTVAAEWDLVCSREASVMPNRQESRAIAALAVRPGPEGMPDV